MGTSRNLAIATAALALAAPLIWGGCGSSNYAALECNQQCLRLARAGAVRGGTTVVFTSKPDWWDAAPDCEGNIVPVGTRFCRK